MFHLMQPTPRLSETHDATRERLLEAAIRLFADQGYERTSIRELTNAAGCNVAAVNYHFGDKKALYSEAFRRLLAELRDHRIRRIREQMSNAGASATLETFLEAFAAAFLEPLLGGSRGRGILAFMDQEMRLGIVPVEDVFHEFIEPMIEVTQDALDQVGPPMSPSVSRLCMVSLVGQLMHIIRLRIWLREVTVPLLPSELDAHIRHVVRFTAGGIRACSTATLAVPE
jgi:AcrR family transcriptional regulator